jgi:hypothetical protein
METPASWKLPETWKLVVQVPTTLVNALDAEVDRQNAARPGVQLSRSDLVRELLFRGVQGTVAESPRYHPEGYALPPYPGAVGVLPAARLGGSFRPG